MTTNYVRKLYLNGHQNSRTRYEPQLEPITKGGHEKRRMVCIYVALCYIFARGDTC
uniref:Uncharacterized protein n=1 Tax=Arion vulgaris TaxID=1028688 RepID=A0A0B7B771_9EUPU